LFVGKADALEGELNLNDIALFIDLTRTEENKVLAEIFTAASVPAVCLDTQRIDVEGVKGLLVVKGVQIDADPIIGPDRAAPRNRCLDLIGLAVEAFKTEVEL
jgi:hypothetical protein